MGDENQRLIIGNTHQAFKERVLRQRVKVRRRFIKDHDRRIVGAGSGCQQLLPLTSGKHHALRIKFPCHHRLHTVRRIFAHDFSGLRAFQRTIQITVRARQHILPDGQRIDLAVLKAAAKECAVRLLPAVPDIHTVHADGACLRLILMQQELDKG